MSTLASSSPSVQALLSRLKAAGYEVRHSPSDDDEAWSEWYETGLGRALAGADVAVVVVDDGWDSSTWMAIESELILEKLNAGELRNALMLNREAVSATALGMAPYVEAFQATTTESLLDDLHVRRSGPTNR